MKVDEGFTVVELILVIVIMGLLASISIPKFINLTAAANGARCASNRAAISYAVAAFYADTLVRNPAAVNWMHDADISEVRVTWFATGSIPTCPTAGAFILVNGNVNCSAHGI